MFILILKKVVKDQVTELVEDFNLRIRFMKTLMNWLLVMFIPATVLSRVLKQATSLSMITPLVLKKSSSKKRKKTPSSFPIVSVSLLKLLNSWSCTTLPRITTSLRNTLKSSQVVFSSMRRSSKIFLNSFLGSRPTIISPNITNT